MGDLGKGQGKTDLTAGFQRVGRDLERRSPSGIQQREKLELRPRILV